MGISVNKCIKYIWNHRMHIEYGTKIEEKK